MLSVIHKVEVARALRRIRGQRIHPHFAGYLCVQREAAEAGRLTGLRPNFLMFFNSFLSVPDAPLGSPYLRPFPDQEPTEQNLWSNPNVAGSYAPSSLRPEQPFRRVVDLDELNGTYSLRNDHAELAFIHLLHGRKLSIIDLTTLLYRDFGLSGRTVTRELLINCFAQHFGYAGTGRQVRTTDFEILYDTDSPHEGGTDASELLTEEVDGPRNSLNKVNKETPLVRARQLMTRDLTIVETSNTIDAPVLVRLRVEGLLSFAEKQEFAFGRLNVIVGPNGAGKSNLVDCLRVFRRTPLDVQQPFSQEGLEAWLNNGLDKQTGAARLGLTLRIQGITELIEHELVLGPATLSGFRMEEQIKSVGGDNHESTNYFAGSYRSEAILELTGGTGRRRRKPRLLNESEYDPTRSILSQVRDISQYPEITRLADIYGGVRIYSEAAFGRADNPLREATSVGRSQTSLSEDLSDLPLVLNGMEKSAAHEKLLSLLREVKETYRDYLTRVVFGRVGLWLEEEPFKVPVPATRLSDGTLHFLALASILLPTELPPVICLEEPELGMHPDMIRMVGNMLKEAATRTQLIVTTHSEHLLTALEDDFDVLFAMDSGLSGTVVRPFTREQYREWRNDHRLGELWTSGQLGGNRW